MWPRAPGLCGGTSRKPLPIGKGPERRRLSRPIPRIRTATGGSRQRREAGERPDPGGQVAEVVRAVDRAVAVVLVDGRVDQLAGQSLVGKQDLPGGEPLLEGFQKIATMEVDQESRLVEIGIGGELGIG